LRLIYNLNKNHVKRRINRRHRLRKINGSKDVCSVGRSFNWFWQACSLCSGTGKPAYKEVVKHFGNTVLQPDKKIDRLKLGNIVFQTKRKFLSLTILFILLFIRNGIIVWKNQSKRRTCHYFIWCSSFVRRWNAAFVWSDRFGSRNARETASQVEKT